MSNKLLKPSKWKFSTYGSGGIGYVISASGGQIELISPDGVAHSFSYGGLGAGLIEGVKPPPVTLGFGPSSNPSIGDIWRTWRMGTSELKIKDFVGTCVFLDASLVGLSGTVMLLGANVLEKLTGIKGADIANPVAWAQPNAVIAMAGVSFSNTLEEGVSILKGRLWHSCHHKGKIVKLENPKQPVSPFSLRVDKIPVMGRDGTAVSKPQYIKLPK
jgi:hypothetical protein